MHEPRILCGLPCASNTRKKLNSVFDSVVMAAHIRPVLQVHVFVVFHALSVFFFTLAVEESRGKNESGSFQ